MAFEETIKEILREVVREEIRALSVGDRLLTAEQVAERLGYPNSDSVRRLAREGHLEAVNLGENTRRYRNSDVQKLIERGVV
jgi:DNA binding domain, excisionase family